MAAALSDILAFKSPVSLKLVVHGAVTLVWVWVWVCAAVTAAAASTAPNPYHEWCFKLAPLVTQPT
jgi:hypothetical protein